MIEESQQSGGDHYEGQIRQPQLTAVLHGRWMFPCGSMIKIQIEFRRSVRRLIGIVSLVSGAYTGWARRTVSLCYVRTEKWTRGLRAQQSCGGIRISFFQVGVFSGERRGVLLTESPWLGAGTIYTPQLSSFPAIPRPSLDVVKLLPK